MELLLMKSRKDVIPFGLRNSSIELQIVIVFFLFLSIKFFKLIILKLSRSYIYSHKIKH